MAQIQVNRLTNANVYVNGTSRLGTAEEVTTPNVPVMMAEHKALGMSGKVELPSGFDKMEMTIKWNAIYREVLAEFANPYRALNLQVRASLESYDSTGRTGEVPVVVYVTGQIKNIPGLGFKQHDNVEMQHTLTCTYVKIEVDRVEVFEYDALANILKVDGVDILAQYRLNIGA